MREARARDSRAGYSEPDSVAAGPGVRALDPGRRGAEAGARAGLG